MGELNIKKYLNSFEEKETCNFVKVNGRHSTVRTYSRLLNAGKRYCDEKKIPFSLLLKNVELFKPDKLNFTEALETVLFRIAFSENDFSIEKDASNDASNDASTEEQNV